MFLVVAENVLHLFSKLLGLRELNGVGRGLHDQPYRLVVAYEGWNLDFFLFDLVVVRAREEEVRL